jgi:hypothetical protein
MTNSHWLQVSDLTPVRVYDLQAGELFLPSVPDCEYFLAGRINSREILVALDGPDPFHVGEKEGWVRAPGLRISDMRFEVDPGDACRWEDVEHTPGALIIASNGAFLIGQKGSSRYAIALQTAEDRLPPQGGPMVGFRRWRLVHGQGDGQTTLFQHDGTSKQA